MLSNTLTETVQGPPALAVSDARVEEAPNVTLDFAVTLNRAASGPVTVGYATSDGTATAGADYTSTSGTLTFAAGETEKTVPVPVLDDGHDEGEETLTLTLSNPQGAWLQDAEATGTIENSDLMPKAWLARFGRTVSEQVLEAISERVSGPREAGLRGRLGGQEVSFGSVPWDGTGGEYGPGASGEAEAGLEALAALLGAGDGEGWPGTSAAAGRGAPLGRAFSPAAGSGAETFTMTGREVLLGSAFSLTGGSADGGHLGAWGRMAVSGLRRTRGRPHARRRGGDRDARGGLRPRALEGGPGGFPERRRRRLRLAGGPGRGLVDPDGGAPVGRRRLERASCPCGRRRATARARSS